MWSLTSRARVFELPAQASRLPLMAAAGYLVRAVAVAAAYVVAAKLGLLLATATRQVTAVWPPTGIAVFALWALGLRMLPAVFAAAWWVNATTAEPWWAALGIALGNSAGPALGVLLLRRYVRFDARLSRVHDVFGLLLLGSFASATITALNGVAWLVSAGIVHVADYAAVTCVWWVADAMGVVLGAPPLLTCWSRPHAAIARARWLELGTLFSLIVLACPLLYMHPFLLTYAVFPFAVWAALRFGPRETALVMGIIAVAAIWGVSRQRGLFAAGPFEQRLMFLVLFAGMMAVTGLVLAASKRESAREQAGLRAAQADLERRVHSRTGELARANADLRWANYELERRGRELARKSAEVDSFVYVVSHDLRGPLLNLQGFAAGLQLSCDTLNAQLAALQLPPGERDALEHLMDEELGGCVRYLGASARQAQRLIDALLQLSRTGRQEYKTQPLDVSAIVAHALAALAQAVSASGAQIDVELLPPAYGDRAAVEQVFSNLIGNALKYLQPGRPGRIVIGGESRAGQVEYWVRDNGVGMDDNARSRLFEVFARFHPQLAPGEGMGLAIVKRVVERHGGRAWAQSVVGEGSTFYFTLPLEAANEDAWRRTG